MNQVEIDRILKEINELVITKNKDYGDSFFKVYKEYGLFSSVIRLQDKIERLKAIIETDRDNKEETLEDTLKDISGYALLSLIALKKYYYPKITIKRSGLLKKVD